MASACLFLMNLPAVHFDSLLGPNDGSFAPPLINIGVGEDMTIRELAETVRDVVGFEGDIRFDVSKPDGTMRKLMDVSRLHGMGWKAAKSFQEGLRDAYGAFLAEW
jgi:GDP-L-fucose synthase